MRFHFFCCMPILHFENFYRILVGLPHPHSLVVFHSSVVMSSSPSYPLRTFELPTGTLGVGFVSGPKPTIFKIRRNSSLCGILKPGYMFEYLEIPNRDTFRVRDCEQLASILNETSHIEGRRITMEMSYPDTISFNLPRDRKHFLIIEKSSEGLPIIKAVDPDLPDFHEVRIGMVLDAIVCVNGYELAGCKDVETLEATIESDDHPSGLWILGRDPAEPPGSVEEYDPEETRFVNQVANDSPPTLMEFGAW